MLDSCFRRNERSWPPKYSYRRLPLRRSRGVTRAVFGTGRRAALTLAAARRHAARRFEPRAPIFPGPADDIRQLAEHAGQFDLAATQHVGLAERERAQLIVGVLAHEDRPRHQFLSAAADHGGAMAVHQHRVMPPERARQRMAFLLLDDQEIGVAELVVLIPERQVFAHRCAEMEHRHDRLAGDGERHDRRRVVVAHRHDVAARLIDAAVDDPLGVEMDFGAGAPARNRACIRGYRPARSGAASASATTDNGPDRSDGAR